MSIFVLNSDDSEFFELADVLTKFVDITEFEDEADLVNALEEDGDAVLLNLDDEIKKKDKLIKKLKKTFEDLPVFVLCNDLDAKKMSKHQSSKQGADIYFKTPVEESFVSDLLSEYFEIDAIADNPGTGEVAEDVMELHGQNSEISNEAQAASDRLENAMAGVFADELSDIDEELVPESSDELSLSEDEISLDDGFEDEEFNLGDDEEFSLGDEDSVDEMSLDDNEGEDLSLAESDDEQKTIFPDEDDLEFPEPTATHVNLANEDLSIQSNDDPPENGIEEEGFSFDEGGMELSVADSADEVESLDMNDGELDLDAFELGADDSIEEPEAENSPEEVQASNDELSLDDSFDLASDDEDISLGEDDNLSIDNDEIDLSAMDLGGTSEDSDPMSASEVEDLSFGIEDSAQEVSLAEESPNDDATILGVSLDDELKIEAAEDISFDDEATVVADSSSVDALLADVASDDLMDNGTDLDLGDELDISSAVDQKIAKLSASLEDDINEEEPDLMLSSTDLPSAPDDIGLDEDDATQMISADLLEEELTLGNETVDSSDITQPAVELPSVESEAPVEAQAEKPLETNTQRVISEQEIHDHESYKKEHDAELERLGETIKTLREDRDHWIEKVSQFEEAKEQEKRDFLNLQAQLDESKIEISIMKKRYNKQIEELKYQLELSDDRKEALKEKNIKYREEVEKLSQKTKVDVHKVRARERELEEKLEMLRADAEIQIKNRDHKILDLKRRIDTLEFDIETSHVKEQQSLTGKQDLEDKMDRVIQTLRSAINQLEDDQGNDERLRKIKKSLDV